MHKLPAWAYFNIQTSLRSVFDYPRVECKPSDTSKSLQRALGLGSGAWGTFPQRDKFNCRHQHFVEEAALSKILLYVHISFQP